MKKLVLSCACFLFLLPLFAHNGPTAINDTVSTPENHSVIIFVTTNDTDATGGQLTIKAVFPYNTSNGYADTLNSFKVIYVPDSGFFGIDSFHYSVCDTFNLCDTATVYVMVLGSNLPPAANPDVYVYPDSVPSEFINVILNDTDPNHDTIFITQVFNFDSTGTLGYLGIDSSNGQVLFTHYPYTCGTEYFKYLLCNYSLCDTGLVTIIVTCPDTVSLPQGISPNGDGKNDELKFNNLLYFSPATLTVFNRYGTVVYQSSDYQNNWDGTYLDTHQPLPDGTYYYVLQLANNKTYNNFLVINR
jgi:gliding motility-associated-like protein